MHDSQNAGYLQISTYYKPRRTLTREQQIKSWKGGEAFKRLMEGRSPADGGALAWGAGVLVRI